MTELPKIKLVRADWIDSTSYNEWKESSKRLAEIKRGDIITTSGIWFNETDDYICIVQSLCGDYSKSIVKIPKNMLVCPLKYTEL